MPEPDPGQPPQESPVTPEPPPSSEPSSLDLPPNVAAAIACVPLIGGIIFYILEKRNSFVRFYAMQSIIFGGAWLLFNIVRAIVASVFGEIPAVGGILVFFWAILAALIQIAFIVLWLVATVKAFTGTRWEIPYIGPVARKQVQGEG
jgi:uncharacterized membrane protein